MAAAQVRTPSVSTPGRRRASRRSWPRAKISAKRISQGTGATRPASSTHASQVTAMRAGSKQTASAPTFCTSTRRSIAGALLPWPDAPTVRQSAVCATVAQAAADPTRRRATIFAWRGVSHVRGANCRRASSRYARAHVAAPHWRTETALAARVRPRRWPSQRRSNQRARTNAPRTPTQPAQQRQLQGAPRTPARQPHTSRPRPARPRAPRGTGRRSGSAARGRSRRRAR